MLQPFDTQNLAQNQPHADEPPKSCYGGPPSFSALCALEVKTRWPKAVVVLNGKPSRFAVVSECRFGTPLISYHRTIAKARNVKADLDRDDCGSWPACRGPEHHLVVDLGTPSALMKKSLRHREACRWLRDDEEGAP